MPPSLSQPPLNSLSQEPKKNTLTSVVILFVAVALIGGVGYVLDRYQLLPFLHTQNEAFLAAEHAQNVGNYSVAKQMYAEELIQAKGDEAARIVMRLALLDIGDGGTEKGITTLRELSQNTTISADIRARAALTALQAFSTHPTRPVYEALFQGEGWADIPTETFVEGRAQVRNILMRGYEHVISLEDLFHARFLLARFKAEDALRTSGAEQKILADEAFGNLKVGIELQHIDESLSNWPPSQIGYMFLESIRAMIPLLELKDGGVISDPTDILSKEKIKEAFTQNIAYFDTWFGRDVRARPYGMFSRYLYTIYLSGDEGQADLRNANLRGILGEYSRLSQVEKEAFLDTFVFVRARGNETLFENDPYRTATIVLAKENTAFAQFLVDVVGGWEEDDFK